MVCTVCLDFFWQATSVQNFRISIVQKNGPIWLPLQKKKKKTFKNVLVKNCWIDLKSIWHTWPLGDQGSHRLEKYLNLEGFLEKSLKNKSALKITGKSLKCLEKSLILPFTGGFNNVFGDLNQYQIVVPLFGAAYAAPNKGTTILY